MATVDERFDAKWTLDEVTGCHVWNKPGGKLGHSAFWVNGGWIGAHVYAWTRKNGPVPVGKVLDHFKCDNPPCVNAEHLRPVTRRENTLRGNGPAALNAAKTHCIRGHELAGKNLVVVATGGRQCRTCRTATKAAFDRRRREAAA